ncbi:hypothetical protein T484DRAFT_2718780 [Baffinella frigidus]|nr:hypothetical protein T484DRAFT_2718780 [Cryptophyta sp. CCMP2293]
MAAMTEHRAAFHRSIIRDILAEPEPSYFHHSAGLFSLPRREESFFGPTSPTSPFDHYGRSGRSAGVPSLEDPFGDPAEHEERSPLYFISEAAAAFDGAEPHMFGFEHNVPRYARASAGPAIVLRASVGGGNLLAQASTPGVALEHLSLTLVGTRLIKLSVSSPSAPPAVSMLRLPRPVASNDIEASYMDGVVRISLSSTSAPPEAPLLSSATAALKAEQSERAARITDLEETLRTLRRDARDAERVLISAVSDEMRAIDQREEPIPFNASRADVAPAPPAADSMEVSGALPTEASGEEEEAELRAVNPYTLHPTPYTLHPKTYTLHTKP